MNNLEQYIAAPLNRSDSDDGRYVKFVELANNDYATFLNFKRHADYRNILEHVSPEQGLEYLKIILSHSPEFLSQLEEFRTNDLIGNPIKASYGNHIGDFSPTTLRYMKVASDIKRLFGNLENINIVEIGCGYGGQLLILDKTHKFNTYTLFDLLPVLQLTSKYLESHILRGAYKTTTLNQFDSTSKAPFDLAISNYAFSELPSHIQIRYIEKVLSKSKRGYLTMNSGKFEGNYNGSTNKLTINQLRDLLPPFNLYDEEPLTSQHNYVICWGQDNNH